MNFEELYSNSLELVTYFVWFINRAANLNQIFLFQVRRKLQMLHNLLNMIQKGSLREDHYQRVLNLKVCVMYYSF